MNQIVETMLLGAGATALVDLWGAIRLPLLGVPRPDYAMVGRWIGHMPRGKFRHAAIAGAAPVRGERAMGWVFHYMTGIAFAAMLVLATGGDWLRHPTLAAAMITGTGTVAAPFLLMQPAMGAGLFSIRARQPGQARLQSLVTHAIFGVGLFLAGTLLNAARP